MYNLASIFDNKDLKKLYNIQKLSLHKALRAWLEINADSSLNLISLKSLLSSPESHETISDYLSSFFYHTIYQLGTLKKEQIFENYTLMLLLFSFDSLYKLLPDGYQFDINSIESILFDFPCLGISISLPPGISRIEKRGSELYILNEEVNLHYLIKTNMAAHENIVFIKTTKDSFFYNNSIAQLAICDFLAPEHFDHYVIKCTNAVNKIFQVEPEFKYQLGKIQYIFPMKSAGTETTKSFTLSILPHIIFLSDSNETIKLSENIVHECLHDELNIFMNYYKLFSNEEHFYFSPWREDPRPIRGLIHAIYVFTGIFCFYHKASMLRPNLVKDDLIFINFRLNLIYYELMLAYHQLSSNAGELTNLGLEFIEKLYGKYRDACSDKDYNCPPSVLLHLKNWKDNNKNYKAWIPNHHEFKMIL